MTDYDLLQADGAQETQTRNQAAERLLAILAREAKHPDATTAVAREALAAERSARYAEGVAAGSRATVERIEQLDRFTDDSGIEYVELAAIRQVAR